MNVQDKNYISAHLIKYLKYKQWENASKQADKLIII